MKIKKLFMSAISIFLCCVFISGTFIYTDTAAYDYYTDVKTSSAYYDAIIFCTENGILCGMGNGIFSPDTNLTRAQLVTVLYRIAGEDYKGKSGFDDVPDEAWFSNQVAWAKKTGIVIGTTSTTFSPDTAVTIEQLCAILYRFAQMNNFDVSARAPLTDYYDSDKANDYAKDAISWALYHGFITEYATGIILPLRSCTRYQIAQAVSGFYSEYILEEPFENKLTPKIDNADKYIIHACGITKEGREGTDFLEALEYNYQRGYRYFEVDFSWTSDGKLVCLHDWQQWYANCLTLKEFEKNNTIYGGTHMTLSTLAEWMKCHPDAYIVTDIKTNCADAAKLIAEKYPKLISQFIIQIYSGEEQPIYASYGFEHIWLTVYQLPITIKFNPNKIVALAKKYNVEAIVFGDSLTSIDGYVDTLLSSGLRLYTHTINGRDNQQEMFDKGIYGVYTDYGCSVG